MRTLHAYKIYRPDVYGGIPHVIAMLSKVDELTKRVLVAREFGLRRRFQDGNEDVISVSSLGTLFSMPVAPSYAFVFARMARAADLVVHHAPFPLVDLGLVAGLPSKTALVVHWHAEMATRPLLARLIAPFVRHTLNRADCIVVSDSIIVDKSKLLAPHAEKCTVVPYGCDTDYWGALDEAGRRVADDLKMRFPKLIVSVGRLVPYKGFETLLYAMASVDAQAVIIGSGPLRQSLERLAAKLEISHKVLFAGSLPRDQIRQYFGAANVFAFPSLTSAEAFGLAQIEAMAAGLPLVNTSLPTAVPRVARHEQEALTVPPGDPTALASALRRLLSDDELARRLGRSASRRAHSEFNEKKYLERMANIYREAVERRHMG